MTEHNIPITKEEGLFLKSTDTGILFTASLENINSDVSFRSVNLEADIDLIYNWVNKEYAKRFWQLAGTKAMIANVYRSILKNPEAHSFMGIINDQPFCQIDVYSVLADELAEHVAAQKGDCGMHLLMCPPREMKEGWSLAALQSFIKYYFSFPGASRLFAEPDHENYPANRLALRAGFKFQKKIRLTNKTANLYMIDREIT